MSDVLTPEQRQRCMSRVGNKNTGIEIALRKALWARGFRYRLHGKVIGKPDICFNGSKVAVFVDGCFWHGCPLHGQVPTTNTKFWAEKIAKNVARDGKVNTALASQGWRVVRCWQHEVVSDIQGCVRRVKKALKQVRASTDGH